MTRPRGTIRLALAASAREISSSSPLGGATWREAAARACVGYALARRTWHDMRRAGELTDIGTVHSPHSSRPMVLCTPVSIDVADAGSEVASAVRGWFPGSGKA